MKCVDLVLTLPSALLPHIRRTCSACFCLALHFLCFCPFCAVYVSGRGRSYWTSGSAVEQVTGAFEQRQAKWTQNGQSMRTLAGAIPKLEAHGDSKQGSKMHFAWQSTLLTMSISELLLRTGTRDFGFIAAKSAKLLV